MKRYIYTLITLSAVMSANASEFVYTATTIGSTTDAENGTFTVESGEITSPHTNIEPMTVDGSAKPWEIHSYMNLQAITQHIKEMASSASSGSLDLFSIADDQKHGQYIGEESWESVEDFLVGATAVLSWTVEDEMTTYSISLRDSVIGALVGNASGYGNSTTTEIMSFSDLDLEQYKTLTIGLQGTNWPGKDGEEHSGWITVSEVKLDDTTLMHATISNASETGQSVTIDTRHESVTLNTTISDNLVCNATIEILTDDTRYTINGDKTSQFLFPDWVVVNGSNDGEGGLFDLSEGGEVISPITPSTIVPEPSTAVMSLQILAVLAARHRRRR